MTHNYHENYNIVVKEFNELMRKCYTRSSVSIEGAKKIIIRLNGTEKEIESNKRTQINNFIDCSNDLDELKKLETYYYNWLYN